jgi:hypothetical protein
VTVAGVTVLGVGGHLVAVANECRRSWNRNAGGSCGPGDGCFAHDSYDYARDSHMDVDSLARHMSNTSKAMWLPVGGIP